MKNQCKNGKIKDLRSNTRRIPIQQPNAQRYLSFNIVHYSYNKYGHKENNCKSRMNDTLSFSRKYVECKKSGHEVKECRSQILNKAFSFSGYCFHCNLFGHKANQC